MGGGDSVRLSAIRSAALTAVAVIPLVACADRSESTAVTIPTATPVEGRRPTPTPAAIATPTPAPTAPAAATATPSPTPEPSLATAKAAALLVSQFGVQAGDVTFHEIRPVQWPSNALGCPKPGTAYAQVIVPGWVVVLRVGARTYEYHADFDGESVVTCDPGMVPALGSVNVARELGLEGVTRIDVVAIGQASTTPAVAVSIGDAPSIATVVASLQADLPLLQPKPCDTLLRVDFVAAGRVASLDYACPGDGVVLRGAQPALVGFETVAPADFQAVINGALAARPFPPAPAAP